MTQGRCGPCRDNWKERRSAHVEATSRRYRRRRRGGERPLTLRISCLRSCCYLGSALLSWGWSLALRRHHLDHQRRARYLRWRRATDCTMMPPSPDGPSGYQWKDRRGGRGRKVRLPLNLGRTFACQRTRRHGESSELRSWQLFPQGSGPTRSSLRPLSWRGPMSHRHRQHQPPCRTYFCLVQRRL